MKKVVRASSNQSENLLHVFKVGLLVNGGNLSETLSRKLLCTGNACSCLCDRAARVCTASLSSKTGVEMAVPTPHALL